MDTITQIVVGTIATYMVAEVATVIYIYFNRSWAIPRIQRNLQILLGTYALNANVAELQQEVASLRDRLTPEESDAMEDYSSSDDTDDNEDVDDEDRPLYFE